MKILLLILLFPLVLEAKSKTIQAREAEDLDDVPYRLSKSGLARIRDNLEIMKANIQNMSESLKRSKENIGVLREELANLFKLEQEHVDLQKKYRAYLKNVEVQRKKNKAGIKRLQSWKERLQKIKDARESAEYKTALRKAEQEEMNRLLWKEDADHKEKEISQLQLVAERNLGRLRIHREEVKRELAQWVKREKEFTQELASLKDRQSKYAKIYQVQKKASPF